MKKRMLLLVFLAIVLSAFSTSMASPVQTDFVGVLYFTTWNGGQNVWSVSYNYNATIPSLTLGNNVNIASLPGADGILVDPRGNLIVAGQNSTPNTPQLYEITIGGAPVANVNAGTAGTNMGAFALILDDFKSNTAQLYNLWNGPAGPTSISGTTLAAGGLSANGVNYTVSLAPGFSGSLDVRGLAFDPENSTWYYGTTPDFSNFGDLGSVVFNDIAHTAVLTPILPNVAAHGLMYDPHTNDIIAIGGDIINQFDPTTGTIVSFKTFPSGDPAHPTSFDNSGTDGLGHLFAADAGNGHMAFIDYAATNSVGAGTNFNSFAFLATDLDDIAPTVGNNIPEPISLILLGSGLVGAGLYRRMRKPRA